jgi:hypothetical protein
VHTNEGCGAGQGGVGRGFCSATASVMTCIAAVSAATATKTVAMKYCCCRVGALVTHTRIADTVRVRVGRPFRARTYSELVAGVSALPWHWFVEKVWIFGQVSGLELLRRRLHLYRIQTPLAHAFPPFF